MKDNKNYWHSLAFSILTDSNGCYQRMSNVIRYHGDDHHENGNEREPPMKEPRRRFQHTRDLEDNQLKEGQTQCECDREDELDTEVFDLIILEQLFYEENKTAAEENYLKLWKHSTKIVFLHELLDSLVTLKQSRYLLEKPSYLSQS